MNWYKQQLINNFYRQAGVLDDLAGAGEGMVDLVKSLISTGVGVKDILASLVKIFGNTAKIPAHILQPLKGRTCEEAGHVIGQMYNSQTGEEDSLYGI